jgi:hypothetical protein
MKKKKEPKKIEVVTDGYTVKVKNTKEAVSINKAAIKKLIESLTKGN